MFGLMQGMEKSLQLKKITATEWDKSTIGQKFDAILSRYKAMEEKSTIKGPAKVAAEKKDLHPMSPMSSYKEETLLSQAWLDSFNQFFIATRGIQGEQTTAPAFMKDFVEEMEKLLSNSTCKTDGKIVLNFDRQYTLNQQLYENQQAYHTRATENLLKNEKFKAELEKEKSTLNTKLQQDNLFWKLEQEKLAQKKAKYSFFAGFGLATGIFGAATWYFQRTK
jgi:hypothetical protein